MHHISWFSPMKLSICHSQLRGSAHDLGRPTWGLLQCSVMTGRDLRDRKKRLTFPEELQEFFRVVIGYSVGTLEPDLNVGTLPTTSGDQNAVTVVKILLVSAAQAFPLGPILSEKKRLTFPEELQEFFRVVIGYSVGRWNTANNKRGPKRSLLTTVRIKVGKWCLSVICLFCFKFFWFPCRLATNMLINMFGLIDQLLSTNNIFLVSAFFSQCWPAKRTLHRRNYAEDL